MLLLTVYSFKFHVVVFSSSIFTDFSSHKIEKSSDDEFLLCPGESS